MDITYHTFIVKLLKAIDYTDDKEKFVNDFMSNIQLQTLVKLIDTLPIEDKNKLTEEFTHSQDNPDKIAEGLGKFFTRDQIRKTSEEMVLNEINDLLASMQNTLSEIQKQKVTELVTETFSSNEENKTI